MMVRMQAQLSKQADISGYWPRLQGRDAHSLTAFYYGSPLVSSPHRSVTVLAASPSHPPFCRDSQLAQGCLYVGWCVREERDEQALSKGATWDCAGCDP